MKLILAAGLALALVMPALAADPPAQPTPAAAADPAKAAAPVKPAKPEKEKLICHSQETTGSLMPTKTCKTAQQWADEASGAKDFADRSRDAYTSTNPAGNK
ncbi:hypothetical protein BH11PSE2_BH11PSE2_16170 [soil metagenome]